MLFSDADVPRVREEIAPGAVWLPGWLTIPQQAWLARQCAQWAAGPVPIRSATVRGHPMSVKTVCGVALASVCLFARCGGCQRSAGGGVS